MSRKDRISLLILVAIFVVLQLMGLLGFFFGTGNMSSINYDRWAGYFIVIGTMTNMVLVVAIVAFLVPPIFRGIINWIERGKDEANREDSGTAGVAESSGNTLTPGKIEHPDGRTTWPFPSQE